MNVVDRPEKTEDRRPKYPMENDDRFHSFVAKHGFVISKPARVVVFFRHLAELNGFIRIENEKPERWQQPR